MDQRPTLLVDIQVDIPAKFLLPHCWEFTYAAGPTSSCLLTELNDLLDNLSSLHPCTKYPHHFSVLIESVPSIIHTLNVDYLLKAPDLLTHLLPDRFHSHGAAHGIHLERLD